MVPPDDAAALAEGMERLMDLPEGEWAAMARAARHKAETEFSLMAEVTMLQQWMDEALAARRISDGAAAKAVG